MKKNLKGLRGFFILSISLMVLSVPTVSYCAVDLMPKVPAQVSPNNSTKIANNTFVSEPEYVPGEIIVKFKEGRDSKVSAASVTPDKSGYRIERIFPTKPAVNRLKKSVRTLNSKLSDEEVFSQAYETMSREEKALHRTFKVKLPANKTVEDAVAEFKSRPDVEYAEPNYVLKAFTVPNDPYYSSSGSWGQPYPDLWALRANRLNCEPVLDLIPQQGEGIVVAVIDTGLDYDHPDIAANVWENTAEKEGDPGVDDDENGYIDDIRGVDIVNSVDGNDDGDFNHPAEGDILDVNPLDDHGHGTHCAGTIAAVGNNGIGVIGVAPRAKIMPIKGLNYNGSGPISRLAVCVHYAADNGAKVISNSYGGEGTYEILTDAFHYANEKGCICVAASGNETWNTNAFSPSNIDTVISVGATDPNDNAATFSNYGDKVEVSAPGVGILSLRADETDMYQYTNEKGKHIVGEHYFWCNGTSMACPHVAGLAALLLSRDPDMTVEEIKELLHRCTDDLGAIGRDVYFGYGRINALKAVQAAKCQIILPANKGFVHSTANIEGSASVYDSFTFQKYELYCAPKDDPSSMTLLNESSVAVDNGILGTWDTSSCQDGEYIITLKTIFGYNGSEDSYTYTERVEVTVDNINEPPYFVDLANKYAIVGKPLVFKIAADPDDPATPAGALSYTVNNLPPEAAINESTGEFSWTPTNPLKKTYLNISFTISDSQSTISKTIKIKTMTFDIRRIGGPYSFKSYLLFTANMPLAIYGDTVAFYENNGSNYTNDDRWHLYNIKTDTEEVLSSGDESSSYHTVLSCDLSDDYLVWIKSFYINGMDVYLYNLHDGSTTKLYTEGKGTQTYDTSGIALDGKILCWDNKHKAFIYDLDERSVLKEITAGEEVRIDDICDKRIIWEDLKWDNNGHYLYCNYPAKIFMYDLEKNENTKINEKISYNEHFFKPVISGNNISWSENDFGDDGYATLDDQFKINIYDITTKEKGSPISQFGSVKFGKISPYKDRIVWDEIRKYDQVYSAYDPATRDLFLYDIKDDTVVQLTEDPALPFHPAISGNAIAWLNRINPPLRLISKRVNDVYVGEFGVSPEIYSITPQPAVSGFNITITGKDFGDERQGSKVFFSNNIELSGITSWADNEIKLRIPCGSIPASGPVKVVTQYGESNGYSINIAPYIAYVGNQPGRFGDCLYLCGGPFEDAPVPGVSKVTFTAYGNKTVEATNFAYWTNSVIAVKVPYEAVTGRVTVKTQYGSSWYSVKIAPQVLYVGNQPGLFGKNLYICGVTFGDSRIPDVSKVIFTAYGKKTVEATSFDYWNNTTIAVKVPYEAVSGPVKVKTQDGYSKEYFVNIVNLPPALNKAIFPGTGKAVSLIPPAMQGEVIRLAGANFGPSQGSSKVIFPDNKEGAVKSWTDTSIDVEVPQGACSGYMKISTPYGESNELRIFIGTVPCLTGIIYWHGTYTDRAVPGEKILIFGWYLGEKQGSSRVFFDGEIEAPIVQWAGHDKNGYVMVTVPQGAQTGSVKITNNNGESNRYPVIIANSAPTLIAKAAHLDAGATAITMANPARWGEVMRLTGINFGASQGSSKVIFPDNREGIIKLWSDTSIDVEVPKGSFTGKGFTVTTPNGASNQISMYVNDLPYLSVVNYPDPQNKMARWGDEISVTGYYFGSQRGNQKVIFDGNIEATGVICWSDRIIKFRVPRGAHTGAFRIVKTIDGQKYSSNASTVIIVP